MAIKFEKIQAGMTLYSRGRVKMGTTTMTRVAEWPVYVMEVSPENRRARVSLNGNAPEWWGESMLKRLYTKRLEKKA